MGSFKRSKQSRGERVCDTPAGKASPGETPQAQRRRGGFPERPRKANAWRVDQVQIVQILNLL
jgi:hypothetical protein